MRWWKKAWRSQKPSPTAITPDGGIPRTRLNAAHIMRAHSLAGPSLRLWQDTNIREEIRAGICSPDQRRRLWLLLHGFYSVVFLPPEVSGGSQKAQLEIHYGELPLRSLIVPNHAGSKRLSVNCGERSICSAIQVDWERKDHSGGFGPWNHFAFRRKVELGIFACLTADARRSRNSHQGVFHGRGL